MLHEAYRPRTWSEFLGNAKAVQAIQSACERAKRQSRPIALCINGPSGTGKTTLAKLVAGELTRAPEFDVLELDGDKCTVDAVRDLTQTGALNTRGIGGYRVVIVNEYHAMTAKAVQAWLTLLERLPNKACVIFTSTDSRADLFGDYSGPFASRSIPVSLTSQGLAQDFAKRALEIAELEGLGGAEPKQYLRLVQDCKNNMRAVLQAIEGGAMMRESVIA
jgi:replication-associated recombination protein RarA